MGDVVHLPPATSTTIVGLRLSPLPHFPPMFLGSCHPFVTPYGRNRQKHDVAIDDIDDNCATHDTIENRFSILIIIFIIFSIITAGQQTIACTLYSELSFTQS